MILYKEGDLCEATEKVIVHGCNALGVMGSGVALAIKNKWPLAYSSYKNIYDTEGLSLGNVYFVSIQDKIIGNAITQPSFGKTGIHVDYNALESCMKKINQFCYENDIEEIAMPMIGAGLGGGDWKIIENIINRNLWWMTVKIYIL